MPTPYGRQLYNLGRDEQVTRLVVTDRQATLKLLCDLVTRYDFCTRFIVNVYVISYKLQLK